MTQINSSSPSREELRISSVEPKGWQPASGQVPRVGDFVYCTSGPAQVVKLLGRTSDGSRLLQLRCAEGTQPFFASSSNVLVKATSEGPSAFLDEDTDGIR